MSSSFARTARVTALAAQGVNSTISTSPLGDSSYGSRVKKPTFLGSTVGAAA